jgi:hypothetical protein
MKIGDTLGLEQRRQLAALASEQSYTWNDPKILKIAQRIAPLLDGPFANAARAGAVDIVEMTDQGKVLLDDEETVELYLEMVEPSRTGKDVLTPGRGKGQIGDDDVIARGIDIKDTFAAKIGRPKVYAMDWELEVVHGFVAAGSLEVDVRTGAHRIPLEMHTDARLVRDYVEWMLDRWDEESAGSFIVKVGDRPRRAWAVERQIESANGGAGTDRRPTLAPEKLFEQVFRSENATRRAQGLPFMSLAELQGKMRKNGLSQSRRRMIVALGERKMPVTEIAERIGCTKGYVSGELKKAGVPVGR